MLFWLHKQLNSSLFSLFLFILLAAILVLFVSLVSLFRFFCTKPIEITIRLNGITDWKFLSNTYYISLVDYRIAHFRCQLTALPTLWLLTLDLMLSESLVLNVTTSSTTVLFSARRSTFDQSHLLICISCRHLLICISCQHFLFTTLPKYIPRVFSVFIYLYWKG